METRANGSSREQGLRSELADALLFAHSRLNSNTSRTLDASAFLYALIEILNEKGLISIEELDTRKTIVAERLAKRHKDSGDGVVVQHPESDKYAFENTAVVDCASKVQFCQAACCRLPFALSKQDIRERVVQWDFAQPYMIAQTTENYCIHLEPASKCCSVREHRPLPCRAYDCRNDQRIWIDFDKNIINPDILRHDWPKPIEEEIRVSA